MNNNKKLLSIVLIFLVILILGFFVYLGSKSETGLIESDKTTGVILSKEEIKDVAMDFINNSMLQGQPLASVVDVTEERGIYKLSLLVSGSPFDSYITKDGKLFFVEGILIDEFNPNSFMNPQGVSPSQELPSQF